MTGAAVHPQPANHAPAAPGVDARAWSAASLHPLDDSTQDGCGAFRTDD